ncbi:DUF7115 domain-containing protein [Halorussus halobius]|uniref:DUF7115 domain-containing protein n=1 Tax=Halorussus halobius TaxID=1710537 RepID=UPI001091AC1B|nr:hypothetical protein [Halorussus halobius]
MSVPRIVQSELDGEQVAAQVPLGGEDALFVTPTRTLVYRADGLLSDESVEAYPHDAERIEISEGRRKSAVELDYGIEGEARFKVPSSRLYEALHPVLAGVLNAAGVTGPDETVTQTYQFSELTLVITSERVVKHVGSAVWDDDYEEYHFADVTRLDVEEGSVSSQIIIETDGRPQRIKTPSDQTREVRERIERALLDYHGAPSYEAFARERAQASDDDPEDESADDAEADQSSADPLAGGVDPIDANPPELDDEGAIVEDDASETADEQAESAPQTGEAASASAGAESPAADERARRVPDEDGGEVDPSDGATDADASGPSTGGETSREETVVDPDKAVQTGEPDRSSPEPGETASDSGFADSGFEPASSELESDDTDEQLAALTEAVERQNELLAEQQRTLETLIDELRRGR